MSYFLHSEPDVGVSRVDIIKKYNDIMFRVKQTESVVNISTIK